MLRKPAQAPTKTKRNTFWKLVNSLGSIVLDFFCFFGACQCFLKSESPNLHRHQKKQQKTKCNVEETSTGTKKNTKKQNFQELWLYSWDLLGSCFVGFFFFGACQWFVKSESPNLHRQPEKTKKQSSMLRKPAQAPKKQNKQKHEISTNYGSTSG